MIGRVLSMVGMGVDVVVGVDVWVGTWVWVMAISAVTRLTAVSYNRVVSRVGSGVGSSLLLQAAKKHKTNKTYQYFRIIVIKP